MDNNHTCDSKEIIFEHVKKIYEKTEVVKDLNLKIHAGERLILLGPSGCGKSTTLRMIAGLEDISAGNLYMNGKRSNDIPCGDRGVAMVFQNYALYPHMTVRQNITYGLSVHKMDKAEIESRLEEVLTMLDLTDYADRKPKELSGGQRQRVALARAVVKRSPYFLLDEPLSNLDAQLRLHARKELVRIHETYHQTLVYVTHDQIEAMTVGQRIALLKDGDLQMVDTPSNIYNHPANVFTAKFIGSPSMNILPAKYTTGSLLAGCQSIELPEMWCRQIETSSTNDLFFGIRPEHVTFTSVSEPNTLKATVKYIEDYGNRYGIYLDIDGIEIIALREDEIPSCGSTVFVKPNFEKVHFFHMDDECTIGYPRELAKTKPLDVDSIPNIAEENTDKKVV